MSNDSESPASEEEPINSPTSKGVKPSEVLPSDRLALDKHFESITAFVAASESVGGAVTNKQAADVLGIAEASIVVVNSFFTEVGILTRVGAGKFEVSSYAAEYARAVQWGREDAGHKLRPLFENRWFAKTLLPRLRMRPLVIDDAVAALAEACRGTKEYRISLERLLQYMSFVGLCRIDGNTVYPSAENARKPDEDERKQPPPPPALLEPQGPIIPEDAPFMFLDRKRERKVTLIAPDSLSLAEVNKIKAWLELVLFVEDETP